MHTMDELAIQLRAVAELRMLEYSHLDVVKL